MYDLEEIEGLEAELRLKRAELAGLRLGISELVIDLEVSGRDSVPRKDIQKKIIGLCPLVKAACNV